MNTVNYEKVMKLVNRGVARRHYTYNATGYITINLGGAAAGYISPNEVNVDIAENNIHIDYGYYIDLKKMVVYGRRGSYPIEKW